MGDPNLTGKHAKSANLKVKSNHSNVGGILTGKILPLIKKKTIYSGVALWRTVIYICFCIQTGITELQWFQHLDIIKVFIFYFFLKKRMSL